MLVLNQYYWPGVEATAHLLTELCEALARNFDVTVVVGRQRGRDRESARISRMGVDIVRVRSTAFPRRRLVLRAVNYLTYLARSLVTALRLPRPDVVLCMTDPPVIGDVALVVARRFQVPLVVISQDVFPEIAVELRRLTNPVLVGALRFLVRAYMTRATKVVAIGETMSRRLEANGVDPKRIEIIPNWVDTAALIPRPRTNSWATEHALSDRFVVMHSGNVGYTQDLDTLIRAATFLRDLDDLAIVIIGNGSRLEELVALARDLHARAVRFLPYQPREVLSQSLSSAHVHVVGLAQGLSGFVVPSRLYGVLAVGRPVIVTADPESESARLVERVGCGVAVPPGDPALLASVIRCAHDGALDLDAMGARGRACASAEADRSVATERYRSLFLEVAAATRR